MSRSSNMTILEISELRKIYNTGAEDLVILDNLSLNLHQGSSTVITGESGSGKSTLLNLIGGLDSISLGNIVSCGYPIHEMNEKQLTEYRRKSIGLVFQSHYLLKDFNALENIAIPARIAGMEKKAAMERACELIDKVGLSERREHFPSQLSGGERQRIALARSLVNDPDLILADEPTGNLDEKNSRIVEDILFSLVEDYKKSLLLVTHNLFLAERVDHSLHLSCGVLKEK
ncbi:MAG: ABC transporter ATP-binding protein [Spirochaetaceae bacterium]|nr:ABC transporter ATP-binding protein [Spirochaetaceae bacterium]